MTPTKEDYLITIFKQIENHGYANNVSISHYLDISKPSVTEMIKRLKEEGLVTAEGRKLFLTDQGMVIAKKKVSIHRIWETFLQNQLDFDVPDVHREADLLEHATSDRLLEAMNSFLNYPKNCPHGELIYLNEHRT
ncbi:metal-dependent transcriptional regulator [Peptoniphilus equinus]|uniref:Manganese transport regulator n=1 Tax=Peptoniphilus equinus TaxID=3016343 RepID=A0ABY7QRG0_9FIRM|nr:metal-dependent transcriptional regulator [Peptoniphilus equinus]WBW49359.1 metal-dependent transcriptional regulator [Peptoniphilus equinus]